MADAFRVRVAAPGIGLVADFAADADAWYAPEWSAQRVAEMLAESAEQWRFSQVVDGGVDALDEEQLTAIEATRDFFTLVACLDRREYVSIDEMTDAIARVTRSGDGVILEAAYTAE